MLGHLFPKQLDGAVNEVLLEQSAKQKRATTDVQLLPQVYAEIVDYGVRDMRKCLPILTFAEAFTRLQRNLTHQVRVKKEKKPRKKPEPKTPFQLPSLSVQDMMKLMKQFGGAGN